MIRCFPAPSEASDRTGQQVQIGCDCHLEVEKPVKINKGTGTRGTACKASPNILSSFDGVTIQSVHLTRPLNQGDMGMKNKLEDRKFVPT